jgi:hypothetical protein
MITTVTRRYQQQKLVSQVFLQSFQANKVTECYLNRVGCWWCCSCKMEILVWCIYDDTFSLVKWSEFLATDPEVRV